MEAVITNGEEYKNMIVAPLGNNDVSAKAHTVVKAEMVKKITMSIIGLFSIHLLGYNFIYRPKTYSPINDRGE